MSERKLKVWVYADEASNFVDFATTLTVRKKRPKASVYAGPSVRAILIIPGPKKRKAVANTEEQVRGIKRANHNRPAERRT